MRSDKLQNILEETIDYNYSEWRVALMEHELGKAIVESLEGQPQDTHYHPEFCTLKHTWLVLQSLKRLDASHLYEAALLHDWGKDGRTFVQKNKISSAGHDQLSAKRVLDNERYVTDLHLTWWITKRHMHFDLGHKRFGQKERYDEPYEDLETFVIADKHMSRGLFFELFPRNAVYVAQEQEKETYRSFAESNRTLYVTVGIPGSGKSTYLKNNFDEDIIVSSDAIREELNGSVSDHSNSDKVWNTVIMRLHENLRDNGKAVFDATNCFKYQRQMKLARLCGYPHRRVGLVFRQDPELCIRRIKNDIAQGKNRSDVPEKVVYDMQKGLEKSEQKGLEDEFHQIKYIKE